MSLPSSSSGTLPTLSAGDFFSSSFADVPLARVNQPSATAIANASVRLCIECWPRQVFRPARARHHVVLDAHAAEFPEFCNPLQVDHLADRLRGGLVQQLVDEVAAGFHRHHEAILE